MLDRILAKKEMVVGTAADMPPLNMMTKEGQIIGVEGDLAFLFASGMNVKLTLKPIPFNDPLPAHRSPLLREQLELVGRSVERNFSDPEDRRVAGVADYKGIGGSRLGRTRGTEAEK